jgi:hypothetical protein
MVWNDKIIGARSTRWAVLMLSLALAGGLVGGTLRAQEIPEGHVLVDDMILPMDVVYGDSVYHAVAWPGGQVFYQFATGISTARRNAFRTALAEIEAISSVRFYESPGILGTINVIPNTTTSGSYSSVGFQIGGQDLAVGDGHWDDKYVLVHETFHALGFLHEQSRPDRDTYVTINLTNVSGSLCGGSCAGNFTRVLGSVPVGAYDFNSIMHYGQFAWAINNTIPTITCKPGYTQFQNQMGNRTYMTTRDAQGMANRYGGPSQPTLSTVSPSAVVAGSGNITITVTGTRFFEGSPTSDGVQGTRVLWDYAPLETTFVDKNTVTAVVPASLLGSAGNHQIVIENDVVAGYRSPSSLTFNVNSPPCGTQNDRIGHGAAAMGDVNNDGHDDFVVSEPGFGSNAGRVRCYSGYTGAVLWTRNGSSGDQLGWGLASLPDITGDGRRELLVGVPGRNGSSGGFRIYNGSNGATLASVDYGVALGGLGDSVAWAGDVDGDGDEDFLVGGQGYNNATGRVELWSVNGGLMRAYNGAAQFDFYGRSLTGGYDMTGDGVPDYAVGAPGFDSSNGSSSGRVYLYSGATGGLITTKSGDASFDYFGQSVAMMPSTTGVSGAGHLVVGAPDYGDLFGSSGGSGYARVFRGTSLLNGYGIVSTLTGTVNGQRFGHLVGNGGDIDQDGRTDIFVVSSQGGLGGSGSIGPGVVDFFKGGTFDLLHKQRRIGLIGPVPSGLGYGTSVAAIGDTNGDTHPDYIVGVPFSDTPCPNAGGFDRFSIPLPPQLGRVLITEVSSGTLDGVELTNFGTSNVSLFGWTLRWKDGTVYESQTLDVTIAPGEIILVTEPGAFPAEAPANLTRLQLFPTLPTQFSDFAVALVTPNGQVVDEVHVEGSSGQYGEGSLGGRFRGVAINTNTGIFITTTNAERAFGLDSDSGGDWYSGGARSFGLRNACGGQRGTDPIPSFRVRINEIDDSPDYLELINLNATNVVMTNWYLLASANQNRDHVRIDPPWSTGLFFDTFIGDGKYLVLGDTSTAPAEKPSNVSYINVGGAGFPWTNQEFDVALYDHYGRLVDYVRASGHDDTVVHNHPRAPSAWRDFQGVAQRTPTGAQALGRNRFSYDTNRGQDWRAYATRTMGTANTVNGTFYLSTGTDLDVVLDGNGGGGLTVIINAGSEYAGARWSFLLSFGHLQGTGPIFGLGPEAYSNWLMLNSTPPWFGFLDSRGTARLDIPGGTVPPGLATDDIFILQDAQGSLALWTGVLEFDN